MMRDCDAGRGDFKFHLPQDGKAKQQGAVLVIKRRMQTRRCDPRIDEKKKL
jgi:hypothetical protein